MPKYEVTRPWAGVEKGQIVQLDKLHPALQANVRLVGSQSTGSVSVDLSIEGGQKAKQALADASRRIEDMLAGARTEAAEIVRGARDEADGILKAAEADADKIRTEAAAAQAGSLTPATPGGAEISEKDRKALIVARLKELNIQHDGRKSADELGALLPAAELAEVLAGK